MTFPKQKERPGVNFLRRFILLSISTILVLGSTTPEALAARPPKRSASADLAISRITESADPVLFPSPEGVDYELTIVNLGPSSGSATLDIRLSGGYVYYVRSNACTLPSNTEVHCDLGLLPTGATTALSLRVHANDPGIESLTTVMTISGEVRGIQPDPDLTNNFKSESTTVVTEAWPSTPDLGCILFCSW